MNVDALPTDKHEIAMLDLRFERLDPDTVSGCPPAWDGVIEWELAPDSMTGLTIGVGVATIATVSMERLHMQALGAAFLGALGIR